MGQPKPHRGTRRPLSLHLAATALALGAGFTAVIAAGVASAASSRQKSVVISTTKNAGLGTILVSGKTLYTLKASKMACTGLRLHLRLVAPR
jgi:hypothetical protein